MFSLSKSSDEELRKLYVSLTQELFDRGISLRTVHASLAGTDNDYPLALIWRECLLHYFGIKMTGGKSYLRMWEFMLRKFGKPMTKSAVLEFCYCDRPNDIPTEKLVDVYICHFRRMLKLIPGEPFIIETIWGTGHKLRFANVDTRLGEGEKMSEELILSLFSDIKAAAPLADVVREDQPFDAVQVALRKQLDKRSVAE